MTPRVRSRRVTALVSIPADACDLLFPEEVVQRFGAQRVAGGRRVLTHREPRDLDPARLEVALVDPVVADEGVGGYDDLPGEGRVSEHLLVACHGGAEDDLAVGRRLGAKGETLVYGAVFEYQVGVVSHAANLFHKLNTSRRTTSLPSAPSTSETVTRISLMQARPPITLRSWAIRSSPSIVRLLFLTQYVGQAESSSWSLLSQASYTARVSACRRSLWVSHPAASSGNTNSGHASEPQVSF